MKRNSVYKSLVISVALSALISGCGSSSSTDRNDDPAKSNKTTISGKAIDGYLQYATVCLDLNKDGYCQATEPSSQTKKDGSFKIDISADIKNDPAYQKAMLLVYGGKDVDTGKDFIGKLLAPKDSDVVNITPLTTIVAKKVESEIDSKELSKEEIEEKIKKAKEEVAQKLGLKVEDIDKDIVSLSKKDKKPLIEALKIQKTIEAIADSEDSDKIEKLYKKLAQNIDKANDSDDLLDKSFKDEKDILKKVKKMNKNIEKILKKDLDAQKAALLIREDIKKIKENKDIPEVDDSIFNKSEDEWKSEFIKADLEDIGANVDEETIQKLKDKLKDAKPGAIFKEIEKADDKDELFKQIKKKIEDHKNIEKIKKEFQKAKESVKRLPFKKGEKFYDLSKDSYTKIELGSDGKIYETKFSFDGSPKDKEQYSSDIVLLNGEWKEIDNNDESYNYSIKDDGSIIVETNEDEKMSVSIVNEVDLSNKEFPIKELGGLKVKMPKGAKMIFIKVKPFENKTRYYLDIDLSNKDKDIDNLDDLKEKLSDKEDWEIENIDGVDILTNKKGDEIYSFYNDKLYMGYKDRYQQDSDYEIDVNYNQEAMDAIKEYIKNNSSKDSTSKTITKKMFD